MAGKTLTLSRCVWSVICWLASRCVECSRCRPIQRSFLFHISVFNVLTLFCSTFLFLILLSMDFFCRNEVSVCRYRSRTSMVCHCVAHQKLIDLSCVMHVTPYFSLQFSFSVSLPFCVVSNSWLIGLPTTPVLCTAVSAVMGITIRLCPLWLQHKCFDNANL